MVHSLFCTYRDYILKAVGIGYDKIEIYIKRFDHIRRDYVDDIQLQSENIEAELDIVKLRQFCSRFSAERSILESILPNIRCGVFHLNQMTFQNTYLPVVRRLLSALENCIPKRSVQMVVELETKANAILTKLMETPDKTLDCLMHIRYLDENALVIDELLKNINYISECFTLMDEYQMVVQDAHRKSQQSKILNIYFTFKNTI